MFLTIQFIFFSSSFMVLFFDFLNSHWPLSTRSLYIILLAPQNHLYKTKTKTNITKKSLSICWMRFSIIFFSFVFECFIALMPEIQSLLTFWWYAFLSGCYESGIVCCVMLGFFNFVRFFFWLFFYYFFLLLSFCVDGNVILILS